MFGQNYNGYPGYVPGYYPPAAPDNLAQLRQQGMSQPTQPAQSSGAGVVWVTSAQQAQEYLVAPNSSVVMWDSNAPVIYLKQADATGKPTMQTYDLVERPNTQKAPAPVGYVTKEDFDALAARVDALAGKKKRKDREEDDEE